MLWAGSPFLLTKRFRCNYIFSIWKSLFTRESNPWPPALEFPALCTQPLLHIKSWVSSPIVHTDAGYQLPDISCKHSPHYIAGVLEQLECGTNTVCDMIRKNGIYVITQTNLCHTAFPKYLFNKSVICKGTVWGKEMEKSLVLTVCILLAYWQIVWKYL